MVSKKTSTNTYKIPKLSAVIFDMDGTITKFNLDITRIKNEILGDNYDGLLLEGINKLRGDGREIAENTLKKEEISAAHTAELNEGVIELIDFLNINGIKTALVTRNNRAAVEVVVKRFGLRFDVIVSREDAPPKPNKAQLTAVLKALKIDQEKTIFIGDHPLDLEAGRRMGIKTVILKNKFSKNILEEADFVIEKMDNVIDIIRDIEGIQIDLAPKENEI